MPPRDATWTRDEETLDALLRPEPDAAPPRTPARTTAPDIVSALLPLWSASEDEPDYWHRALATLLALDGATTGFLATYDVRRREPRVRIQRGCGQRRVDGRATLSPGARLPMALGRALEQQTPVIATREQSSQLAQITRMLELRPVGLLVVHPLIVGEHVVGALLLGVGEADAQPSASQLETARALAIAVAGALQRWTDQLTRLEQVKSDVVAALSHELRTPLTAIRGYAEVLADGEAGSLNDEQREYLAVIDTAARRLQRQVDDLVMLTRIQAGPMIFEPRTLGVSGALERAAERIRERAATQDIAISLDIAPSLPLVRIDPHALDRTLEHLLDNAVKFTPPGETIAVRCARVAGAVTVSITNTGVVIEDSDRERVFAAFYRTTSALRDAVQGAGLGLTIVKSLVEQHGGRIWLEGTGDARTTFTFTLPVAPATRARDHAPRGGE
jgi:signal transduction histidine kinase